MPTDLVIVWPPGVFTLYVMNGVPGLMGYASSIGLRASQIDASIGFERYLLSERGLQRHKPAKGNSLAIHEAWHTARGLLRKHLKNAYEHGDSFAHNDCFDSVCSYYNLRYPDTYFQKQRFILKDFSFESSLHLKPAADYLMPKRNHPLIAYYRDEVLPRIVKVQPRIVGISVSSEFQVIPAMLLAKMIRQKCKRCHITFGGRWGSSYIEQLQYHNDRFFDPVDSFTICDGEPALDGFKEFLDGNRKLHDINNLLLPGKSLQKPLQFCDIRHQPPPVFDAKILAQYMQPVAVPIEFARGCYWGRCSFCTNTLGIHSKYRSVNMPDVIKTMNSIRRHYGINDFFLSTLAAAPAHLRSFIRALKGQKKKYRWTTWVRLDEQMDANLLEDAYEAGCTRISFAPESLTQRTLNLMNKGYKASHILELLDNVKSLGRPLFVNIIAGFPGERMQDLENTLALCYRHGYRVAIFPFCLEYSSGVFTHPDRYGIIPLKGKLRKYDITFALDYRVRKGTPHYRWYDVREKFIEQYKEWFVGRGATISGYDVFEFDRRDVSGV